MTIPEMVLWAYVVFIAFGVGFLWGVARGERYGLKVLDEHRAREEG